jgi:hypothetical protein
MKDENFKNGFFALFGLAVILLAFLLGVLFGEASTRDAAIKNNAAYYSSDAYGHVTFHWNSNTNR